MVVLLMSLWLGIQPAAAQYTSNYQTNIISGVTSNWPGDYVIGSNTFCNALLVRNGGVLTNADSYVGCLSASVSNSVMVSGAGSVWTNANQYVGFSGGGNSLVITNAGRVANSLGTYVANDGTSMSNRVLVTGTNSIWDCANNLALGLAGSGNSLVITNGGRVSDSYSQLGSMLGSDGNSALITGGGSVWSNTASCAIGLNGSNNKMTINKGGRMVCNYATIGAYAWSSNNSMLVTDTNSLWDDSAEASVITVGQDGSGNSLVVTNGGKVLGYYAYFGRNFSGNNSALVTGPGSSFSVNCYIFTGDQGHDNTFTAAKGSTVSDKFCYISYSAGSTNNTVLITDTNSSWQNSYSVFVGFDGGGGSLTISNGATMSSGGAFAASHDGALGVDATSSNNRALVTGGGSVWNCADNLYVGLNGPGNNLVISNGGRVINTDGYVGANPGSDYNSVLVTGTNSVWTNSADFYVGDFSAGNSLVITNGGRVINNGYGYLGRVAGSVNNSVRVVGTNSVWTNHANMYVGCYGGGNSLVVSNGGRVTDDYGTVGYDTNCFNNQALVAGAGSVWSNSTVVFVGDFGSTNSLVISHGGLVVDNYGLVGEEVSGKDNTVYVESGGVWRNQQLCIGDMGSHNAMFVEGGSVFVTTYMAVGYNPLYYNNLVELDSGQIVVTNQTHDAELEVYGGGFLLTGGTLIVDTLVITNDGAQFMHIGGTLIYRNLQLDPALDTDSDGIPNGWEQAHGLDPLNPDDAAADNDGDGMSNLQEYLAGTNPTNAASHFAITSMALTNGNVRVSWSAVGGKHYVLQTNSALGTAFFDASPAIAIPGTSETVTNYLDRGAATNGQAHFYRIRIAP